MYEFITKITQKLAILPLELEIKSLNALQKLAIFYTNKSVEFSYNYVP